MRRSTQLAEMKCDTMAKLREAQHERAELQTAMEKVEVEIGHLKYVVDYTTKFMGDLPEANGDQPSAVDLTTVDLTGARNHRERLVLIAQANGGVINVTAAADVLIAAGVTKGTRRNVVSMVYRMLKDPAWQQIDPGDFRYAGEAAVP